MNETDFTWAQNCAAAVTVCNKKADIIFMNNKAMLVFAKYGGNLIGKSLYDCHNPHSIETIQTLLKDGGTNAYTIEKNGIKKMIHQSAWLDQNNQIGGLIEISMEIPITMPHFVR